MERTTKAILAVFVAIALFIAFEALVSGSEDNEDGEEVDESVYYVLVSQEKYMDRYDEDGNLMEKDATAVTDVIRKAFSEYSDKLADLDEDDLRWLCVTYTITTENTDPGFPKVNVLAKVPNLSGTYTYNLGVYFSYCDSDMTVGEEITVNVWYLVPRWTINHTVYPSNWVDVSEE